MRLLLLVVGVWCLLSVVVGALWARAHVVRRAPAAPIPLPRPAGSPEPGELAS